MEPIPYSSEVDIRPRFKRVLLFAAWASASVVLFFVAFFLYCVFCWPTHGLLRSPPQTTVFGLLAYALAIPVMAFVDFLCRARRHWLASADGIDVYVGEALRETIPWNHVKDVTVLPGSVACRYDSVRGRTVRMYWVDRKDGEKLREMWKRNQGVA